MDPLTILSTDDDQNIRALLWHILSDAGHSVDFAKDGEEVFRRLADKRYDLVILDVNMPKINGYKVSELIHDKFPRPPKVIIFTGRDPEKENLQFVCSGADAILTKGTGNDKLLLTIESLFSVEGGSPAGVSTFVPEPAPPGLAGVHVAGVAGEALGGGEGGLKAEAGREGDAHLGGTRAQEGENRRVAANDQPVSGTLPDISAIEAAAFPLRLLTELNALKVALLDIRRLLGHLELKYEELGKQFEGQVSRERSGELGAGRELMSEWQSLRRHSAFVALLLLIAILAVAVLPPR